MAWRTPKIVEVPAGMEINMCACAARKQALARLHIDESGASCDEVPLQGLRTLAATPKFFEHLDLSKPRRLRAPLRPARRGLTGPYCARRLFQKTQ